jgi:hypothetical protein
MKRDMNLIREILLWAEKQEHGRLQGNPNIEGFSDEEIGYHVSLMEQAGLVKAFDMTSMADKSPNFILLEITWLGHEFLDASRDNKIWKKAKEVIIKPTVSISFDLLLAWLKAEAKKQLGM